jgi:hypothetical protein
MCLARAAEVTADSYSLLRRLLHGLRRDDWASQRQGGYVIVKDNTFNYFPTYELHQQDFTRRALKRLPHRTADNKQRINSVDDNEWLVSLLADSLNLPRAC